MTDMLDRLFGPDPDQGNFPKLDQSKIIPFHDCEYVESRTWGWHGMVVVERCPVCMQLRPPADREEP